MGGKLLPIDIISQKQALENQEKIKTIIKTVILCGRQNFSDRISTYGVFSTKSAREKRKEFSCFITIVHKRAFGFSNIHTKNKYCEYLKIILFRPLLQKKKKNPVRELRNDNNSNRGLEKLYPDYIWL